MCTVEQRLLVAMQAATEIKEAEAERYSLILGSYQPQHLAVACLALYNQLGVQLQPWLNRGMSPL